VCTGTPSQQTSGRLALSCWNLPVGMCPGKAWASALWSCRQCTARCLLWRMPGPSALTQRLPSGAQCVSGLDASSSTLADTLRPETGQCMLACEHMSCVREYCRSNVETHTCVSGIFSLLPIGASLTRCRRAFVMRSVPVMLE